MKRIRLFALTVCLFALWEFPGTTAFALAPDRPGLAARLPRGPGQIRAAIPGETDEPPFADNPLFPKLRAAVDRGCELARSIAARVRHPRTRCR